MSCLNPMWGRSYAKPCDKNKTINKKASFKNERGFLVYGAAGKIRTHDPLVRSQVLYPTELQPLKALLYLCFLY
mgnify:CR=1 FL=1